jgi:hypothetical protein
LSCNNDQGRSTRYTGTAPSSLAVHDDDEVITTVTFGEPFSYNYCCRTSVYGTEIIFTGVDTIIKRHLPPRTLSASASPLSRSRPMEATFGVYTCFWYDRLI